MRFWQCLDAHCIDIRKLSSISITLARLRDGVRSGWKKNAPEWGSSLRPKSRDHIKNAGREAHIISNGS
jgi:hypothetical protein